MKLYKYYSFNALNLTALINKQFWASKPTSFNDPYDTPVRWIKKEGHRVFSQCRRLDDGSLSCNGKTRSSPPVPFPQEEVERALNMGIICFSRTCECILLWSHYADQHKGYVLEFDLPDDALEPCISPRLIEVKYDAQEKVARELNRYVDAARFKEKAWQYEKEVRFVVDEGNQLYDWNSLRAGWFDTPSGIIFGSRMDAPIMKAITELANKTSPNIDIRKAELSNESFKLNINSVRQNDSK